MPAQRSFGAPGGWRPQPRISGSRCWRRRARSCRCSRTSRVAPSPSSRAPSSIWRIPGCCAPCSTSDRWKRCSSRPPSGRSGRRSSSRSCVTARWTSSPTWAKGVELFEVRWTEVPSPRDAVNLDYVRGAMKRVRVVGGGIICWARNAFPVSTTVRALPVMDVVQRNAARRRRDAPGAACSCGRSGVILRYEDSHFPS